MNLDVPDEVILDRISDRWVHLPSGRVYNLSYNRPRIDGLDDETGEPLTKRPDDNPVRVGCRWRIKLRRVPDMMISSGSFCSSPPTILRVDLATSPILRLPSDVIFLWLEAETCFTAW